MSETKFTEGPWKVEFTGPHWNNKELRNIEIQYGEQGECVCDTVYKESDANLIAAAPEMYEMLEEAKSEITHLIDKINEDLMGHVNCQTITPPDLYDMETCYRIQVLLAKARGEHD